jgi:uncharacterized protein (TIGR03032 family)
LSVLRKITSFLYVSYQAWRNHINKGVVYDILEERVVCSNLSSPHSPKWYRPPGYEEPRLWLLESGKGQFGYVDLEKDTFVPKIFIPGFLRGIDFIGSVAIICSSKDRFDASFAHIPLGEMLAEKGIESKCAIWFINLDTFDIDNCLIFKSGKNMKETYDISAFSGVVRSRIISFNDPCLTNKIFQRDDV